MSFSDHSKEKEWTGTMMIQANLNPRGKKASIGEKSSIWFWNGVLLLFGTTYWLSKMAVVRLICLYVCLFLWSFSTVKKYAFCTRDSLPIMLNQLDMEYNFSESFICSSLWEQRQSYELNYSFDQMGLLLFNWCSHSVVMLKHAQVHP